MEFQTVQDAFTRFEEVGGGGRKIGAVALFDLLVVDWHQDRYDNETLVRINPDSVGSPTTLTFLGCGTLHRPPVPLPPTHRCNSWCFGGLRQPSWLPGAVRNSYSPLAR